MINLNIQHDIDKAVKQVGKIYKKQIPFAASVALNKTAEDIQRAEQKAMETELDQPRPSTIKGVRVQGSNKRNLGAAVYIIPHIDKFLRYQIHGGRRPPRSKTEAVPFNLRLNKYGNIPGRRSGKLAKLLARPDTFSATIKGVAGIWQRGRGRNKHQVKLLVAYENATQYRPRFRFYQHAERAAAKAWGRNFSRALSNAIKTARI